MGAFPVKPHQKPVVFSHFVVPTYLQQQKATDAYKRGLRL